MEQWANLPRGAELFINKAGPEFWLLRIKQEVSHQTSFSIIRIRDRTLY